MCNNVGTQGCTSSAGRDASYLRPLPSHKILRRVRSLVARAQKTICQLDPQVASAYQRHQQSQPREISKRGTGRVYRGPIARRRKRCKSYHLAFRNSDDPSSAAVSKTQNNPLCQSELCRVNGRAFIDSGADSQANVARTAALMAIAIRLLCVRLWPCHSCRAIQSLRNLNNQIFRLSRTHRQTFYQPRRLVPQSWPNSCLLRPHSSVDFQIHAERTFIYYRRFLHICPAQARRFSRQPARSTEFTLTSGTRNSQCDRLTVVCSSTHVHFHLVAYSSRNLASIVL